LDAYKEKIKPCSACGICDDEITCKYKDFKKIKGPIENSDLIILASPIYNMSLPSPLKAIIDRMQPYFAAKFRREKFLLEPKKVVLILTCGSSDERAPLMIRAQVNAAFNSLSGKIIGQITWTNTDTVKKMTESTKRNLADVVALIGDI
jgi:multimeric flavodoxin WrbA